MSSGLFYNLRPRKRVKTTEVEDKHLDWSTQSGHAIRYNAIKIPEILAIIFMYLDLRSLKTTRLVCKFWLSVAQMRLSRFGVVKLEPFTKRAIDFHQMLKSRKMELAVPFSFLLRLNGPNVKLETLTAFPKMHFAVSLSQFFTAGVPLYLSLKLIQKYNKTLETLDLHLEMLKTRSLHWFFLDSTQSFPNLKHLSVRKKRFVSSTHDLLKYLSATVACIANSSRSLKFYHAYCSSNKLGSLLMQAVNIKRVKNLILEGYPWYCMDSQSVKTFNSIQFSALQFLRIGFQDTDDLKNNILISNDSLLAVLNQANNTIRTLDLSLIMYPQKIARFPVCPVVQKLTVSHYFEKSEKFLSLFPALKQLTIHRLNGFDVRYLNMKITFPRIKVLIICNFFSDGLRDCDITKLFVIFPGIETLCASPNFVVQCCRLKFFRPQEFHLAYKRVRHVVVHKPTYTVPLVNDLACFRRFCFLTVLTRLEKITLSSFLQIMFLKLEKMPSLTTIFFPWAESKPDYLKVPSNKLLKLAESETNIYMLNCCKIRQNKYSAVNRALDKFFTLARNAGCGCNLYSSNNVNCCPTYTTH